MTAYREVAGPCLPESPHHPFKMAIRGHDSRHVACSCCCCCCCCCCLRTSAGWCTRRALRSPHAYLSDAGRVCQLGGAKESVEWGGAHLAYSASRSSRALSIGLIAWCENAACPGSVVSGGRPRTRTLNRSCPEARALISRSPSPCGGRPRGGISATSLDPAH
jgi:hypothetical protein